MSRIRSFPHKMVDLAERIAFRGFAAGIAPIQRPVGYMANESLPR
jgi:hypothetical protein